MTPVWSPEAINDLVALRAYIEQDDPNSRTERCTSHRPEHRNITSEHPRNGATRPSAGHTRTCDPEDALYRALPFGREHGPDSPYLPQCSSVARSTLKDTSLGPCAST